MENKDELLLQANYLLLLYLKRRQLVEKNIKKHRFWVRRIFKERKRQGLYHTLFEELRLFDGVLFPLFLPNGRHTFRVHATGGAAGAMARPFFCSEAFCFCVKEIIIALVILLFGNVTKKNKTIDIFSYVNNQLFLWKLI